MWFYTPTIGNSAVVPEFFGAVHLGLPLFSRLRGLIPASGVLNGSIDISDLGPGVDQVRLFEAAAFVDLLTLDIRLANPTTVLVLDSAL